MSLLCKLGFHKWVCMGVIKQMVGWRREWVCSRCGEMTYEKTYGAG